MIPYLDQNPRPAYKQIELTVQDALHGLTDIVKKGSFNVTKADDDLMMKIRRYSANVRGTNTNVTVSTIWSELVCMDVVDTYQPTNVFDLSDL